jgi:hypothetical protein
MPPPTLCTGFRHDTPAECNRGIPQHLLLADPTASILFELFRQAAVYADRILKREKPADLPEQLPTKFEMTAENRTAKTP